MGIPQDPRAQLDAIERRRRWKLAVQCGGILLVVVGVVFLPIPKGLSFTKRHLSFFSIAADSGMFLSWGYTCILAGVLALLASFLIRVDTRE